jgi:hypothetical protein
LPYVLVPHEPNKWVEARVENQHYRVYDAERCQPVSTAER